MNGVFDLWVISRLPPATFVHSLYMYMYSTYVI